MDSEKPNYAMPAKKNWLMLRLEDATRRVELLDPKKQEQLIMQSFALHAITTINLEERYDGLLAVGKED